MKRNFNTKESRAHWDFVKRAASLFASWPQWKKDQYAHIVGKKTNSHSTRKQD